MINNPICINVTLDGLSVVHKDPDIANHSQEIIEQYANAFSYAMRRDGYRYNCAIPINNCGDVFTALSKDDGSVKQYWNPARTSLNDDIALREQYIAIAEPYFDRLWEFNCIQELHVAIDIANSKPDDSCSKRLYGKKTMVVSNERGETETIYHGVKPAPSIVYDKGLQLHHEWDTMRRDSYREFKRHYNPPSFPMMRVEERARNIKRSPRYMLENPIYPFYKLEFHWYSGLEASEKVPKLFIDSCHYRGLKPALARLPANTREEVLEFLKNSEKALDFGDALEAEVERAHQKLLILAPEKLWKAHVKSIPKPLRNYRHTGIITRHLLQEAFGNAKRPHAQQMHLLQSRCASDDWKAELLGKPITRKLAEDLILASPKSRG